MVHMFGIIVEETRMVVMAQDGRPRRERMAQKGLVVSPRYAPPVLPWPSLPVL